MREFKFEELIIYVDEKSIIDESGSNVRIFVRSDDAETICPYYSTIGTSNEGSTNKYGILMSSGYTTLKELYNQALSQMKTNGDTIN